MTPDRFCDWLHGYVELTGRAMPTPEQWASICDHLDLIYVKVTPDRTAGVTVLPPAPWDRFCDGGGASAPSVPPTVYCAGSPGLIC